MTDLAAPTSDRRGRWADAIALSFIVLFVYGRLVFADFVEWDDPHTIRDNPAFNPPQWWLILQSWGRFNANLYAPLTYTIWGALTDLSHATRGRLEPAFFHTTNVMLHLASTLVVWSIVRQLFVSRVPALVAAAVFAVHPVQVEAVAWASGLKDVLCGLCVFLAIDQLLRDRPMTGAACMLLACLAKPTGVVAAPMALVVLYSTGKLTRSTAPKLAPWFVIAVVFAVVARLAQTPLREHAPLHLRPLIAADALAFYATKLIWPTNLSIDYGRTPAHVIDTRALWYTWLVPAAIGVVAIVLRRRTPLLLAGMFIALIGVSPVVGLVPFTFQAFSTVADHYLYASMLGVAIIIAAIVNNRRAAQVAVACIVFALAAVSFVNVNHWKNDDTLFAHVAKVSPRSTLPYTNWSISLARRGLDDRAIEQSRKLIDRNPNLATPHLSIAAILQRHGDSAGAARHYREVLRIYASQPDADPQAIEQLRALVNDLESKSSKMPPP